MKQNHSSMLFNEANSLIKSMGLTGTIAPSEIVIAMQTMAIDMATAIRYVMAQRGVAPATTGG